MSAIKSPLIPPLGPLYGSIFFGSIMSTAFYGVACMQTFFYYVHYQHDPWRIRMFVAIQWAINTIHEALSVAGAFKYIMAGLGHPVPFQSGVPELLLLNLATALVTLPTQGFFIYRIYVFSGKKIIFPLIWVTMALVEFVCCIIFISKALYSANGVHVVDASVLASRPFVIIATLGLSVAAGIDILIAICMTFLLVRHQKASKSASTVQLLQRLIVFAVNTGTWTAIFALLTVTLLHLLPSNLIYTAFIIPQCQIYCITLLANLNVRGYVERKESTNGINLEVFINSLCVSDGTKSDRQSGEGGLVFAPQGVWKMTEVETFSDAERSTTPVTV